MPTIAHLWDGVCHFDPIACPEIRAAGRLQQLGSRIARLYTITLNMLASGASFFIEIG